MASSYSTRLKLELPVTNELVGTWGVQVNNAITSLIDETVDAVSTIAMANANTTLTIPNGLTSPNRAGTLRVTGAHTAIRTLTLPAGDRTVHVINATTGGFAILVKNPASGTVSIDPGYSCWINIIGAIATAASLQMPSAKIAAAVFDNPVFNSATGFFLDGTAAAPTISFTSDINTGLYRAGAETIGFTTNGVNRLSLSTTVLVSTLPVLLPGGTNTAPSFGFSGNPDTGMYAPSAGTVGLATGGVLRFHVGGSTILSTLPISLPANPTLALEAAPKQYVDVQDALKVAKIGDTMSGALVISGTSTTEMLRVTQLGTGDVIRVEDSANPDATPFVVNNIGNVGIQVPAPTVALDIFGDITLTKGSPVIKLNKTLASAGISYFQWLVADSPRHQFYMSGAEDTPTGGATGSDFAMQRFDNSGASPRLSWHILRLGGEWGINGIAQAGVGLTIRSDPTAPPISDRGINLLNLNTGTDASTDITFSTASNALRARIRGGKEGAANAGRMVFSTTVVATESDVLTLASDKSATFASHINTAGYVNIKRSLGPYIMLDTTDATPRQRAINSYTNGLLRWSMHMGSSDVEDTIGGGTGSDFALFRYTDAGATPTIGPTAVFNADRETGNVAIGNNGAVSGVRLYVAIQANEVVQDARAIRVTNGNTASDASVSMEFVTSSGSLRGQIRGKREAATNHGSLILSSALTSVAQDVLTLDSAKTATFGGAIVGGTIQAQSLLGGSTATEIAINAAFSTSVAPPVWPTTNGGMISARGNTNGNYAAGAVSVYSGSGSTGVALLPGATAWSVASDEREKHILGDVADGLAAILGIKPIRFRYLFEDSEAPARIGFGAHNVQKHIPEAATPVPKLGKDGKATKEQRLMLAPTDLLPHIVNAIQQLVARIEALEKPA